MRINYNTEAVPEEKAKLSEDLNEQIKQFLAGGGKIQQAESCKMTGPEKASQVWTSAKMKKAAAKKGEKV